MQELARSALSIANRIQSALPRPPKKNSKPEHERLIDSSLVKGTRLAYLSSVIDQINGPFEHEWYDASSVMLRRLVETLIIEAYEKKEIECNVRDSSDNYLPLKDLVVAARDEPKFKLTRTTKKLLTNLKKLGDLSAHNKKFNAKRDYMENLADDFYLELQTLVKEFVDIVTIE